jgi:hypothetical protein
MPEEPAKSKYFDVPTPLQTQRLTLDDEYRSVGEGAIDWFSWLALPSLAN